MKKTIPYCLLLFTLTTSNVLLAEAPLGLPQGQTSRLVVNNRILARVNGKTISVIDVMKKMDMYMNRYYPQHADSLPAKFQFYSNRWKDYLRQIIDTELMLADAEEKEIKVSDGDVRETLQERLGPNVMSSLDKLGLTYEEARAMIHSEMIVERMTWFKVTSKVMQNVSSQDIKASYQERFLKTSPEEQWKYQVLSIRANDPQVGEKIAEKAYALLAQKKMELAAVAEELKQEKNLDPSVAFTISQDYEVPTKALSASLKDVLASLTVNSYSPPISQVSRTDKGTVYRIFYLKDHIKQEPPSFAKMAEKLKDELREKEFEKENDAYLSRLRERYGYDEKHLQEEISEDFQPFSLN